VNKRKVVIRRLDGQIIKGYMEAVPNLSEEDTVTITSLTEEAIRVPKRKMKALFFVRKFSGGKQYSGLKFFETQPKIDGLWVRLTFHDGEATEGIIANSVRFLSDDGFYVIPVDPSGNNRLIYVVKAALKDFRILGMHYSKRNIAKYVQYFENLPNAESSVVPVLAILAGWHGRFKEAYEEAAGEGYWPYEVE
jgi:hypothetical protein